MKIDVNRFKKLLKDKGLIKLYIKGEKKTQDLKDNGIKLTMPLH